MKGSGSVGTLASIPAHVDATNKNQNVAEFSTSNLDSEVVGGVAVSQNHCTSREHPCTLSTEKTGAGLGSANWDTQIPRKVCMAFFRGSSKLLKSKRLLSS